MLRSARRPGPAFPRRAWSGARLRAPPAVRYRCRVPVPRAPGPARPLSAPCPALTFGGGSGQWCGTRLAASGGDGAPGPSDHLWKRSAARRRPPAGAAPAHGGSYFGPRLLPRLLPDSPPLGLDAGTPARPPRARPAGGTAPRTLPGSPSPSPGCGDPSSTLSNAFAWIN